MFHCHMLHTHSVIIHVHVLCLMHVHVHVLISSRSDQHPRCFQSSHCDRPLVHRNPCSFKHKVNTRVSTAGGGGGGVCLCRATRQRMCYCRILMLWPLKSSDDEDFKPMRDPSVCECTCVCHVLCWAVSCGQSCLSHISPFTAQHCHPVLTRWDCSMTMPIRTKLTLGSSVVFFYELKFYEERMFWGEQPKSLMYFDLFVNEVWTHNDSGSNLIFYHNVFNVCKLATYIKCECLMYLLAGGTLDIGQHSEVIPNTSKACQNLERNRNRWLLVFCFYHIYYKIFYVCFLSLLDKQQRIHL